MFDEGMLVHGARNKILFRLWDLDEWNDFYLSPILSYIKWGVLSLAGVGIAQERLIPLPFSFLTLIVFYLAMKESFDRRTAVLAVSLLGFNSIFLMFNRLGLTETSLVFVMVLTAYLWQKGFARPPDPGGERDRPADDPPPGDRPRPAAFFLSGMSCFVAFIFKNFPYFLPVPIVATLLSFRIRPLGTQGAGGRALAASRAIALGLLGMFIPGLVGYVVFYRRYAPSIEQAMSYYQYLSVPAHLQQALSNIANPPFFDYFAKTPVVLLFSSFAGAYVIYLFFHDRHQLRPLDLFMLCWYLAHFLLYTVLNYRPVRHYVPVIPQMCALAARAMVSWSSARAVTIPPRFSLAAVPFLVLWLTLLLGYGLFPLAYRMTRVLPAVTWERRMLAVAAVSVLIVGSAALISRAWGGRSWAVPRRATAVAFLGLPVLVAVFIDGYHYARWALHPRFVIHDLSRELGRTLNDAYIAGLGAPMIVLENTHRALHVYENFFNYRNTFDRYPITHLFMGAFNQEVDFYYRAYAAQMRRATLVKIYPIKDSHFYLYSMVEPSIERIRVSKETHRPHEEVRVTLAVKNNDAAGGREVKAGWVLHPLTAGSADIAVTAPSPVILAPGETRELVVSAEVPPDNTVERPIAQIDVAADGSRKILARRELRGVDFRAPRSYEEFELSNFRDDLQTLEFRVGPSKRADAWIDRIRVEFTRGEWYERPITVAGPRR